MSKHVKVAIGDQVFAEGRAEAFGSVRQVSEHELVVDIENFGDVRIPSPIVVQVHDGKVVVDTRNLPGDVRAAIAGAHAAEDR